MRRGGIALYRIGAGLSMIVAPLFWLASAVLGPGHGASQHLADSLPHIAADPDRFLAFILLGLLSHVFLIRAVFGVAHLVTGQRSRIAFRRRPRDARRLLSRRRRRRTAGPTSDGGSGR